MPFKSCLVSPRTSAPDESPGGISLIALAYNHARYLPQLFESIRQNINDIAEIFLIDNGSSDSTECLMREFAATLPSKVSVKVRRNPPRFGPTIAVNAALKEVNQEFVAVTSGDDFLLSNRFRAQLCAMQRDSSLAFCYSNGYVCDERGILSSVSVHDPETVTLLRKKTVGISDLFYPVPALFTQCGLFRRQALLDVGGWDEDLVIDDWPLNIKLFSKFAGQFAYIDAHVAAYRRHESNASKRRYRQYIGQKRVLEKYARNDGLRRGMFSLYATQLLASLRRKQWWRARRFARAALSAGPGFLFVVNWFARETQRRLSTHKIR